MFTRFALLVVTASQVGLVSRTSAQEGRKLGPKDAARVEQCRRAILECHLRSGAIPLVGYRLADQHVRIDPYFANLACLGVLAAHEYEPNEANLTYVRRWLAWYAAHQEKDGTIANYDGTRARDGDIARTFTKETPDSYDSYAATYLLVAGRFARAAKGKPEANVATACGKCVEVLERCRGHNGLYWNFNRRSVPEGKAAAQYLLDNIEVYQGLTAATDLFRAVDDEKAAAKVGKMAKDLAGKMGDFWYGDEGHYVCLYADKAAEVPFGTHGLEAEGLATVSALAFFDRAPGKRHSALWGKLMDRYGKELRANYATETLHQENPTVERVYLAARRVADAKAQSETLRLLRDRTDSLLARNRMLDDSSKAALPYPYVHRFGLIIVALLSRTDRPLTQLPTVPIR